MKQGFEAKEASAVCPRCPAASARRWTAAGGAPAASLAPQQANPMRKHAKETQAQTPDGAWAKLCEKEKPPYLSKEQQQKQKKAHPSCNPEAAEGGTVMTTSTTALAMSRLMPATLSPRCRHKSRRLVFDAWARPVMVVSMAGSSMAACQGGRPPQPLPKPTANPASRQPVGCLPKAGEHNSLQDPQKRDNT